MNPLIIDHTGLVRQSANGDRSAMEALCDAALERANDPLRDRGQALVEALVYARLAATDGSIGRVGRLLSVMALLADECAVCDADDEAARLQGEGLAMMNALADSGIEIAGEALASGAQTGEFSPLALSYAKEFERAFSGRLPEEKQ